MPHAPEPPLHVLSLDPALGRKIIDVHIWAVRQGLRGAAVDVLFDGFCQRLVIADLPLWRLSVKSTAPYTDLGGEQLIEWGGGLRWLAGGNRTDHA